MPRCADLINKQVNKFEEMKQQSKKREKQRRESLVDIIGYKDIKGVEQHRWKNLDAYDLIALYFFIECLKRREDYEDLRKANIRLRCNIRGRQYTIGELSLISMTLPYKTVIKKVSTDKEVNLSPSEKKDLEKAIKTGDKNKINMYAAKLLLQDRSYEETHDINKMIKDSYDKKLLSHISYHPGLPKELLLEQFSRFVDYEKKKFFKDNPFLTKEMFLDKRDTHSKPRLIPTRDMFERLELSIMLYDKYKLIEKECLKNQRTIVQNKIIEKIIDKLIDSLTEHSDEKHCYKMENSRDAIIKSIKSVYRLIEKTCTVSDLSEFLPGRPSKI